MNDIKNPKFFTGGRAVFTVANNKGQHYTYRIATPKKPNPSGRFTYFASLLTGPNNEHNFTYMGIFNPEKNTVLLTYASRYREDSTPLKVICWALQKVTSGTALPEGYSIKHEGRCCRCGRTLTDPTSIELGIGPECRSKVNW